MDRTAIEAIVKAVEQKPQMINAPNLGPLAFVPAGFTIKELSEHLLEPDHVVQRVTLLTAEDFVGYWKRFKTDTSVVFGDERCATYTAIIDFHGPDGMPRWCDHVAVYACPTSKEWDIWRASNGKRMAQAQFAEFIEDNYPDITKPSHAEMLQISTSMQAKKSVQFSQSTRLDNGQSQLMYQEEVKGSVEARGGSMKIPDGFSLKLPVFLGGQSYPLEARLRYRIDEGKLSIWYDLHRPHKLVEMATQQVTSTIYKAIGTEQMFLGATA